MTPSAIRVAVAGARGKMGTTAIAALEAASDLSYVGGLVRTDPNAERSEFSDVD